MQSKSVAKRAALKLVSVLPEPVVCQMYPPLSLFWLLGELQFLALKALFIFHKMRSVAAIW